MGRSVTFYSQPKFSFEFLPFYDTVARHAHPLAVHATKKPTKGDDNPTDLTLDERGRSNGRSAIAHVDMAKRRRDRVATTTRER
jgi:hypothetical protein